MPVTRSMASATVHVAEAGSTAAGVTAAQKDDGRMVADGGGGSDGCITADGSGSDGCMAADGVGGGSDGLSDTHESGDWLEDDDDGDEDAWENEDDSYVVMEDASEFSERARKVELLVELLPQLTADDAEKALPAFKWEVSAVLDEWEKDEVGVREMLGLLETPEEVQSQRACDALSRSINDYDSELKKCEKELQRLEGKTYDENWCPWSREDNNNMTSMKTRKQQLESLFAVSRKQLELEQENKKKLKIARLAFWSTNALPGKLFLFRAGMDVRELELSRHSKPQRVLSTGCKLFRVDAPGAAGTFPNAGAEWHFRFVETSFTRACSAQSWQGSTTAATGYKVTAVDVNENAALELRYNKLRAQFLHEGKPIAEELVFHGTQQNNIDKILRDGFEIGGEGVAVAHGSAYGKGVYVARNPTVSMGYSRGTHTLLLCKILVGVTSATATPLSSDGKEAVKHDSVDAGWAVIAQRKEQVLPKYLVHWTNG